jgi:hypothetical protein
VPVSGGVAGRSIWGPRDGCPSVGCPSETPLSRPSSFARNRSTIDAACDKINRK